MSWTDLLFAHWRVDPAQVQECLPKHVELDAFDGSAWIALVPFKMTDCRFRGFGWVPGLRNFYECNVRTYVRVGDRAGVWFFSLDAQHLLPVLGGRCMWNLPYVYARFNVTHSEDNTHDYRLTRRPGPWSAGATSLSWRTGNALPAAQPGTLKHFLTERYWLFTVKRNHLFGGRIHHDPWPLREATVERLDDTLISACGFPGLTDRPPDSLLASTRLDVAGDPLVRIE